MKIYFEPRTGDEVKIFGFYTKNHHQISMNF